MKGHHSKSDDCKSSVLALQLLLTNIIKTPEKYTEDQLILNCLKSQGALAAIEITFHDNGQNHSKNSTSLNTLKAHANQHLPSGFDEINQLRVRALSSITTFKDRESKSNKRTKTGLLKRTQLLEHQLSKHQNINFILLQALSSALSNIRTIRDTSDESLRSKRAQDGIRELTLILSMNPPPFNSPLPTTAEDNVTTITKYKKKPVL